ncbi:hypothetical protein KPC_3378 [Acinetobacter stercoris]|uniref:Lipid/polyisoprenoid-binding YceI-like domain-containing protein n=1 Tax=Acinetobacter stercoris TaxID=2126983 RepID=A0A2U3N3D0_9GAMM|nr:hypothetical protein KPC_3378 [Acinetobacter stercoris]
MFYKENLFKARFFLSFIGLNFIIGVAFAANWSLSPESNVGFYIESMGIKVIKGKFTQVQSDFNFDIKAPQNAQTTFVIHVNSLNLNKSSMQKMMLDKNRFHAEKYKTIMFKSTQFKLLEQNKYAVSGQLTLRGVTRPVVFMTELTPTENVHVMNIRSRTQIDRKDYGMKPAFGGIGEKVNLVVDGQIKVK